MNGESRRNRLIDFNDIEDANKLLSQIGVETDLGSFLSDHLQDVLQKQYLDLTMESITLLSVGECIIGGSRLQGNTIADVESLEIPIAIETVVTVQNERHCLKLDVTVRATSSTRGYEVESDVIIKEQRQI